MSCTLCKAGFKLPHGHIYSLEEFQDILKRIVQENKK